MDARSSSIKAAPATEVSAPMEKAEGKSLRDRVMLALFLLLLGALANIAICWGLAFQTELTDDASLTGQGVDGPRVWRVMGWSGFGSVRIRSIRDLPNWSVMQAAGPPY